MNDDQDMSEQTDSMENACDSFEMSDLTFDVNKMNISDANDVNSRRYKHIS